MSNLTLHKFSDLYKMSSGISSKPEQAGHGSPFLSFSKVFNNYFLPESLSDFMDVSPAEQMRYSVRGGDIFLTRTSETIDELGMSSVAVKDYTSATYSGFLKRLRPTQPDITYHKYMAFYLRSKLFRKTMTNNAVLTLRASLNEDIFSYLNLLLPDYNEQVKIGNLLYLLNQKIELNNKINSELEKLAKTIYDYWFVQFDFPDEDGMPYRLSGGKMVYNEILKRDIPEDWSDGTIEDFGDIIGGSTPSTNNTDNFCTSGIPWITPNDLSKNIGRKYITRGLRDITEVGKKSASLKVLPRGAVLMSSRAPIGYMAIARNPLTTNQGFKSINPSKVYPTHFIYYAVKNAMNTIVRNSSGSTFKEISGAALKSVKLVLPEPEITQRYVDTNNNIFRMQGNLELENDKLEELRDWLLPMLMNGQVTVGEKADLPR